MLHDILDLHVDLRKPLDELVEDLLHTHGPDMALMELERHAERIKRQYAAVFDEPHDVGGVPRADWFARHRCPVSGLLKSTVK